MYGELQKLGYDVHWQTVRRVMLDHGLLDDPDKRLDEGRFRQDRGPKAGQCLLEP